MKNRKILATFMALGMVTMGFALLAPVVPAADEPVEPMTVPTLLPINYIPGPIVADVSAVAFTICGWCDVAVDVSVEVGNVADFAIGTGSEGIFTGVDGTEDNFASGVYRIQVLGLSGSTVYHWRATLTNGADTIYFPALATTATAQTGLDPGTPVVNGDPFMGVVDEVTLAAQNDMLGIFWINPGGQLSFPYSQIGIGTNFIGATGNNFRSSAAPFDYLQDVAGMDNYWFVGGMWDDGGGPDPWLNEYNEWVEIGQGPMNFAYETHILAPGDSATATGPIGAGGNLVTLTYTWTGAPPTVDIFWTIDGGTNWNGPLNDGTVEGSYAVDLDTLAGPNTYDWIANAPGGDDDVGLPAGGTAPEAGSYIYAAGIPPQVTASTTTGTIHNGDHANEQMTLTGTVDDTMNEGDVILSCQIQITDPNAVTYGPFAMAMTTGGGTPVESFDYTWIFPNTALPEGDYFYEMRGTDAQGANATWDGDGYFFTITDTTPPTVSYNPLTPPIGTGRSLGTPVNIYIDYVDFTEVDLALPLASTLFYWNPNQGEAVHANSVILQNISHFFGSWNHRLMETITMYGAVGDTIFYDAEVYDSSAGGPIMVATATWNLVVTEVAITPGDPYPIYGYTLQYDGTDAGGYAPTLVPGATVTVVWFNDSIPGWSTITTTSNALAQFSVDILNYTDFGFVYVNVTANPIWGNLGYNWTQIDVVGFPGGRWQNVICGVPYNVTITAPIPLAVIQLTAIFPVTYIITDRDGLLAVGYYTYLPISPDRSFVNITAGVVPPLVPPYSYTTDADQIFDGTISATPATYTANMQMFFPPGQYWYINVSEGGQTWPDTFYLTPWNNFFIDPGLSIQGWLKDWDNITIELQSGGFDWLLSTGWNLVSCPQDATYRVGLNVTFDSEDALEWVNVYLLANFGVTDPALSMADRIGGNPSTYMVYDVGTGEGPAYDIDTLHGYWVQLTIAGSYVIHFDSMNATTTGINTQDAPIEAGWNLMGFQHNFTLTWTVWPTASMFTDGVVDTSGFLRHVSFGGGLNKVVITEWTQAKWYNSYVVDLLFPGMPAKNWLWDSTYSTQPGNGFWVWADAGGTMTYSTIF